MAVTDWDEETACFADAYSSHPEVMNTLRQIGFTGQKDYRARRAALPVHEMNRDESSPKRTSRKAPAATSPSATDLSK